MSGEEGSDKRIVRWPLPSSVFGNRLRLRPARHFLSRMADDQQKVRIDKWLWAARFYKTRALAADAVEGGKVEVGGARVKRSKLVQAGDSIRLRLGPYEHIVTVLALSERRGPASVAATLYAETPESRKTREDLQLRMKAAAPQFAYDAGKPSKKQRRDIDRLRGDRK